ncbi:hypothetical protein L7F22_034070 [Adiantum nelumboides]|nr:hypothetical protein [Adiantum nelumboides]
MLGESTQLDLRSCVGKFILASLLLFGCIFEASLAIDACMFEPCSYEDQSIVNFLVGKLQKAMGNPTLKAEVQGHIIKLQFPPNVQEDRALERPLNEISKKGTSLSNQEEMYEEPSQRSAEDGTLHQELSKKRDGSDTPLPLKSDVASRRRAKRSPSPVKKKGHQVPLFMQIQRRGKINQERPSSSSSSSPSSYDESSDSSSKKDKGEASVEAMRHGRGRKKHHFSYLQWNLWSI